MENLEGLTLEERERLLKVRKKIQLIKARDTIKSNFLSFVKYVWPEFIEGSHHKKINDAFTYTTFIVLTNTIIIIITNTICININTIRI